MAKPDNNKPTNRLTGEQTPAIVGQLDNTLVTKEISLESNEDLDEELRMDTIMKDIQVQPWWQNEDDITMFSTVFTTEVPTVFLNTPIDEEVIVPPPKEHCMGYAHHPNNGTTSPSSTTPMETGGDAEADDNADVTMGAQSISSASSQTTVSSYTVLNVETMMWEAVVSPQCVPIVQQQLEDSDYYPLNDQSSGEKIKTSLVVLVHIELHRSTIGTVPIQWYSGRIYGNAWRQCPQPPQVPQSTRSLCEPCNTLPLEQSGQAGNVTSQMAQGQ
eukprot:3590690-Amphidinium_carterae.1